MRLRSRITCRSFVAAAEPAVSTCVFDSLVAATGEFPTGGYVSEVSGNLETDWLENSLIAGIKETESGASVSEE